jgi:hypothetical protein
MRIGAWRCSPQRRWIPQGVRHCTAGPGPSTPAIKFGQYGAEHEGGLSPIAAAPTHPGVNLSFIYLVALWGVGIAIVAVMLDAVISVSRAPSWKTMARPRTLQLVETEDRRTQQLPFVGKDRRAAVAAPERDSERVAA